MKISTELREKLARLVPAGYNIGDLRVSSSLAQVQELTDADIDQLAVAEIQKQAGPPLINEQGKPTVMRIVSWVGHADVANKNGDAFVREELHALAGTLFQAPDLGVMDFNHSAVRMFSDEPKVVGVWYKAEWAFDQTANGGQGAWGIIATGILFSWLFPEIADRVLADQERNGGVRVSWTWIPGSQEFMADHVINHNPVFFTVSVLDVAPADPDAVGSGTEDPTVAEDELRRELAVAERVAQWGNQTLQMASLGGQKMNDQDVQARLDAAQAEADRRIAEITTQVTAKDTKISELEASLSSVTAEKESLETQVAELTTSKEAAATELTQAAERIQALEQELAGLKEQVAAYQAKEAEAEKKTRLATRKEALPESYRKAHESRNEETRARVEAKWAAMSDEEWEAYLNDELSIVPAKVGFVLRSTAESAGLPNDGTPQDIGARVRGLLK